MAGLITALRSSALVGIDTAIFIYRLEQAEIFGDLASDALESLALGEYQAVTQILTLMELTVKPWRLNQPEIAREYEELLVTFPNLSVAMIDVETARHAAQLRAVHRLLPADALQIVACIESGAQAFLTNDRDLRRVTEIPILLLSDFLDG